MPCENQLTGCTAASEREMELRTGHVTASLALLLSSHVLPYHKLDFHALPRDVRHVLGLQTGDIK